MGHAQPRAPDAHAARGVPVGTRQRVSVLVVDDDEDTRDMLSAIITHAGYSVATAANGREALALMHSMELELILLDIQMPAMDGFEFRQAQRRDPTLIKIPTAVMTGSKEEPTLDVAVVATLAKPFGRADLLNVIERYCRPPED